MISSNQLVTRVAIGFVILILVGMISCESNRLAGREKSIDSLSIRLDSIGQSFIASGEILGFSVAIMQGADTLFNKGFGYSDIERTKSVTSETRFLLASVSKLIGSTVVMKLVDEGKLSLDQTLGELLPDFPNPEQAQKITLRHMLSHTSGLQDYAVAIDSAYVKTRVDPTKEDVYDFLRDKKLFFEPGSDYSYCNTGFYLMGLIVEKVTAQPFQYSIDRIINKPTGMDLRLIAEAVHNPLMSQYWERKDSVFIPKPHWTWIKGDGGLTATAGMLAQFPRAWAAGKIISKDAFETMVLPTTLTNGIETGYGIGVRNGEFFGERIIGHTGGNKSPYAIMVFFPESDMTFVCFMNTDNTPRNIRRVFAGFATAALGREVPNFSDQKDKVETDINRYADTYQNFDYKMENTVAINFSEQDRQLQYCMGSECFKMYELGNHKFWIEEWPYDFVAFNVDEKGEVLALQEYYTGFYSVLRKKLK